uniref:Uncharacterized protein n=1 Tax=Manihot esculenta TaxID=3983 RepID=A0A2C9U8I4_MANES
MRLMTPRIRRMAVVIHGCTNDSDLSNGEMGELWDIESSDGLHGLDGKGKDGEQASGSIMKGHYWFFHFNKQNLLR